MSVVSLLAAALAVSLPFPVWTADLGAPQVPEVRTFAAVRGMRVAGEQGPVGVLEDLVVEVPSGRICSGVVAIGSGAAERRVAIAYEALLWDGKAEQLWLDMTGDELRELEAFDPARSLGLVRLEDEADPVAARAPAPITGRMMVSGLTTCAVRVRGAVPDVVRGAAVELETGTLAFLIVAEVPGRSGDRELHPVPWAACALVADPPAPKKATRKAVEPVVRLALSSERLALSPALTQVYLNDPLYRTRIYRFFGVDRPIFDAEH